MKSRLRADLAKAEQRMAIGLALWLAYFTATYVVVKFLIRGLLMHFAQHPWAQGMAAVTEA